MLGKGVALRFRGACRDGVTTACTACGQTIVYRKPRPGPTIHGQTAGPRDLGPRDPGLRDPGPGNA